MVVEVSGGGEVVRDGDEDNVSMLLVFIYIK